MIRLFVGIAIPRDVRHGLAAVCAGLPGARWVAEENIHLTLRFIGNVDEAAFDDVADALSYVRAPAFDLAVEGVGQFARGRHPSMLWAGVAKSPALTHLQERIESALVRAGLPPERRRFTPHVTLARLKDTPRGRLHEFLAGHGLLRFPPFRVESFALFSSFLAHTGAIHRTEAEYPLALARTASGG